MRRKKKLFPPLPLPSPSSHKQQPSSTFSSSSSTSLSSFSSTPSTFPSPSPSPSPSPYYNFSSVPFSWERKPGIPFTPLQPRYAPPRYNSLPLPLPPSKVKSLDGTADGAVFTIRRRRRALELLLALIRRLRGLDPYHSCISEAADDVANGEAKSKTSTSRRHRR